MRYKLERHERRGGQHREYDGPKKCNLLQMRGDARDTSRSLELMASTQKEELRCGRYCIARQGSPPHRICSIMREGVGTWRMAVRMPVRGPTEKPAPSGRWHRRRVLAPAVQHVLAVRDGVLRAPRRTGCACGSPTPASCWPASRSLHTMASGSAMLCRMQAQLSHKRNRNTSEDGKQVHCRRTKEQHVVSYLLLGERFNADQLQSLIRELHRRAQVRLWCTQRSSSK